MHEFLVHLNQKPFHQMNEYGDKKNNNKLTINKYQLSIVIKTRFLSKCFIHD